MDGINVLNKRDLRRFPDLIPCEETVIRHHVRTKKLSSLGSKFDTIQTPSQLNCEQCIFLIYTPAFCYSKHNWINTSLVNVLCQTETILPLC